MANLILLTHCKTLLTVNENLHLDDKKKNRDDNQEDQTDGLHST